MRSTIVHMNVLRAILASLMSLICTLAVSGYVILQTVETTLLDKQQVKTWFQSSNIYGDLFPALVNADQTVEQQTANASSSLITKETIQAALNKTFDTAYVQAQTEKVIDSTYSWLNGTGNAITFSINTTEKKQSFIENLAAELEPKLAALPQCANYNQFDSTNPTCLPPGATAKTAAQSLATDAANSTTFFNQPITNQTVDEANKQSGTSTAESPLTSSNTAANNLPALLKNIQAWGAWLPLLAIVSGGLCIVLSRNRFKASKHLTGRLTVGLALTAALGLVIASLGAAFEANAASTIVATIVVPVVHQAAPAIGNRLAFISGSLALATCAIWLTLTIIKKRREKAQLLRPPAVETPQQKPPAPPTQNLPPTSTPPPSAPTTQ